MGIGAGKLRRLKKEDEQMKIAMIGQKKVPSREGGVEIIVEELSTRMAAQGHEVTLFNRKRKREADEQPLIEYKGCKIKEIFTINKKSLDAIVYAFFATLKVRKMAKKGEFDILHFSRRRSLLFSEFIAEKRKTEI